MMPFGSTGKPTLQKGSLLIGHGNCEWKLGIQIVCPSSRGSVKSETKVFNLPLGKLDQKINLCSTDPQGGNVEHARVDIKA